MTSMKLAGRIERKTLDVFGKIMSTIVELRDAAGVGSLPALGPLSVAVDDLRQLYLRERQERIKLLAVDGFDIDRIEEKDPPA